jgi:hypothetical protein
MPAEQPKGEKLGMLIRVGVEGQLFILKDVKLN